MNSGLSSIGFEFLHGAYCVAAAACTSSVAGGGKQAFYCVDGSHYLCFGILTDGTANLAARADAVRNEVALSA